MDNHETTKVGAKDNPGNDLPVFQRHTPVPNPYATIPKRNRSGSDDKTKGELGTFAKRLKETIQKDGMHASVHVVKKYPQFWPVKIALLDFINPKKQFPHWLHRPNKWQEVISIFANDLEGRKRINRFLEYLTPVRIRDHTGKDASEQHVVKLKGGKDLALYHNLFLIVLPKNITNDMIPSYIRESFSPVLNDTEIQACYHMSYTAVSDNQTASEMLTPLRSNSTGQEGKYWSMLEGALMGSIDVTKHESLNKILTSTGIVTAIALANNTIISEEAVKGKNIPEGLKEFIYGISDTYTGNEEYA